jgi:hypothetical protein
MWKTPLAYSKLLQKKRAYDLLYKITQFRQNFNTEGQISS